MPPAVPAHYFGEQIEGGPCGHCDNCEAGTVEKEQAKNEKLPFALKSCVRHSKWGEGTVMKYEDDKIVVLFEEQGVKNLVAEFVVENEILRHAGS